MLSIEKAQMECNRFKQMVNKWLFFNATEHFGTTSCTSFAPGSSGIQSPALCNPAPWLLKLCIFGLILVSSTLADKPSSAPEDILKEDLKAKITTVVKDLKQVADERSDTIAEKSDIVDAAAASSSNYEAGAPVSQGNLYYYYYPVAAYPVHSNGHGGHASDKVSSGSSSALGGDLLESPLVFILVPLVLLLIAAPLVALYGGSSVSTSRSFGSSRSSNLDDKFGSFDEFQDAIDMQLMKYTAALDSERCMDRIVCELGVRASNIPHKNLFFR